MTFVKLDCGILDSSLWVEPSDVRVVFITMLALCDIEGLCAATAPGIAKRANLPLDAVRLALDKLAAPDPDSRSTAEEGRRIIRVDGGFRVVNYLKYRKRDDTAAERMRRYRQRKSGALRATLRGVTQEEEEVEVEEEVETPTPSASGGVLAFYNKLTARRLSPGAQKKFIRPRLKEGVADTTLKLAVIGACLSGFHVGDNDRKTEYLDPETIFRPGRIDGHAARARTATSRNGSEVVWAYWMARLKLSRPAVMEHFFRARDELLLAEGGIPIGPAALDNSRQAGEPWSALLT